MTEWSYRGRWGLITGASSGLGAEFARQLAARGMNLILSARREERLAHLADELTTDFGIETVSIPADLAEPDVPARLWDLASDGRAIHLLVNNAGFGAHGRFDAIPLTRQTEMVAVNCTAVLALAHRAVGAMRERGEGGIINVASIAAFQPVPSLATYAATKAFVLSLSEALQAENRAAGVRVLALCPGRTPTEFQEVAGSGSAVGAFGMRTSAQVIEAGLDALERGSGQVVPGLENRLATWVSRIMPDSIVARVIESRMGR